MDQQNPLKAYFRTTKFYMTLPCDPSMYPEGVIEYSDTGEVGVMGMTAGDEMLVKNPDALLNGTAITSLLSSCIPNIKKPDALIANDIDACLLGIKHASFGDDIDTAVECPSCSADNTFSINISQSLATISKLDPEYFIETEDGMRIYAKPMVFPLLLTTLRQQFEQEKIVTAAQDIKISEERQMKLISTGVDNMAKMSRELLLGCIDKITIPDREEPITNTNHIEDFLNNVEKTLIEKIEKLLSTINNAGIKKTMTAKCKHCEHEWEVAIDFNPMTFFMGS